MIRKDFDIKVPQRNQCMFMEKMRNSQQIYANKYDIFGGQNAINFINSNFGFNCDWYD